MTDARFTKLSIAGGGLGGLAIYACGYLAWPAVTTDPVRLALWLAAGPGLVIYAMFLSCLRMRDSADAIDPFRGAESPRWKVNQRALTNTVEQAAIFVPVLLALSTRVDPAHARVLPLGVACWVVARLAFWIGYRFDQKWRAPGMAWTHVTTLVTIGWLVRCSL
jgi:uncharacterized MAPEG superfamily protein